MYSNNQVAINIAKNPVHHDRTKYIEIDRYFIKEKVKEGIVKLVYVPTNQQIADIMTKSLSPPNFENMISKLGVINSYS